MKLVVLLLTVTCLHVNADSYAQKVTLKKKNAPLENVFETIYHQTGYQFVYSYDLMKNAKKVTINVKDASLEKVLKVCFANQPFTYTLQRKAIIIKRKSNPTNTKIKTIPPIEVTGIVTDSLGNPLIGVTIKAKSGGAGTVTDANGNYSITVSDDAVLIISYVGYQTKEIRVNGRREINIELSSSISKLNQLVVVGYGTQERKNIVGSISQIEMKDISSRPSPGIANSLQGAIPGLNIKHGSGGANPTETPQINIRGFTSINGGSPLVLVNGIETDISDVNPNDIKSVTVLKDAGSSAIYGARGAFGVILITTKKGRSGQFKVEYSNNFGWATNTIRRDFIINPYKFGRIVQKAMLRSNNIDMFRFWNDEDWEIAKKVGDGQIEPYYEKQSDGTYKFYGMTDFYHVLFRKWRPLDEHNISVSGGSEKLNARLSGRLYNQALDQNIQKTNMKRYNLNFQLNFKPFDWIEIGGNSRFSKKTHKLYGGLTSGWIDPHNTFWAWNNVFPNFPAEIDGLGVDIGRSRNGVSGFMGPQFDGGHSWRKWKYFNLLNTIRINITPFEGLEINANYSNESDRTERTYRLTPFTFLKSNKLKKVTDGKNRMGEWRWKDHHQTINIFGTYQQTFGSKNHFKLMLGFNQEQFDRDRIGAQIENLISNTKSNLRLGTDLYNIVGSTLAWGIQGFYGRLNYNFDQKYLLELNARYDGSSRFPSENRWGFFPSIGIGWRISNENFWRESGISNVLSSFKLRGSYGSLGNQNIPANTFLSLLGLGQQNWLENGNKTNYASIPSPLPSSVTWETVNSLNIGADFGFLENHLNIAFDWYTRTTKHMYLPGEPLPAVFGASEPKENKGALENRGFELTLTYRNSFYILGSKLTLNVGANVSNFKGRITQFNNRYGLLSTFYEGEVLGIVWGYHIDGQFQTDEEAKRYQSQFADDLSRNLGQVYNRGIFNISNSNWDHLRAGDIKYADLNGDGRIDNGSNTLKDHGDLRKIANFMPKFPFGFNINAEWRDFDLTIIGQGIGKQDWYPRGATYWGAFHRPYHNFIRKDLMDHVWDPEASDNSNNYYPQLRGYSAYGTNNMLSTINDYYLTNIGYLRVKNLTLGYTLPENLTKNAFINKLRIYVSAENLATLRFGDLTKYIDPETASTNLSFSNPNSATATYTQDYDPYPIQKVYSFGINIVF